MLGGAHKFQRYFRSDSGLLSDQLLDVKTTSFPRKPFAISDGEIAPLFGSMQDSAVKYVRSEIKEVATSLGLTSSYGEIDPPPSQR